MPPSSPPHFSLLNEETAKRVTYQRHQNDQKFCFSPIFQCQKTTKQITVTVKKGKKTEIEFGKFYKLIKHPPIAVC